MRFGIVILPEHRWSDGQQLWRRAEEYGFDHAWTYDHIGWRDLVDGPWFAAVPTLTAAALATERIKLGTLVASANFRHPAAFAREVTALDDISGGRFLLGVGAGGTGYDSDVLGQPDLTGRQRVDRFGEFVSLLDQILTSERTTYEGDWFAAVDARSNPGPLGDRIPFVVAANGPRSLKLAARYGTGWVTTGKGGDDIDAWWAGIGAIRARFEQAVDEAGRDAAAIDSYLFLDSAPVFSLASVDAFTDAVGRATELGFTDVITHWPRKSSWYAGDEAVLDEVASTVLGRTS